MDWWQALVLGIVEGVTEYLPVSSTGHLILAQRLMGIPEGEAADAYAVCIQAGAILAVLGLYWPRVRQMLAGLVGRDRQGLRLALCLLVAFLPAAVVGALLDETIERHLFGLWPITAAWLVGGAAILVVSWVKRDARREGEAGSWVESLTWGRALAIGLAQCLAMWPGTSRSLVTIVAGVLAGLGLAGAVEFSFLLGLLTLTAATGYKAVDGGLAMVEAYGWGDIAIGFVAATASAAAAVKWMVSYLNKHSLSIFGYYRVGLAAAVGVALVAGLLR